MQTRLNKLRRELASAFRTPTGKQKEAYERFCHTLSAAAVIGVVTVVHMDNHLTVFIAERAIALVFSAVVLFVIGAALSKGE